MENFIQVLDENFSPPRLQLKRNKIGRNFSLSSEFTETVNSMQQQQQNTYLTNQRFRQYSSKWTRNLFFKRLRETF